MPVAAHPRTHHDLEERKGSREKGRRERGGKQQGGKKGICVRSPGEAEDTEGGRHGLHSGLVCPGEGLHAPAAQGRPRAMGMAFPIVGTLCTLPVGQGMGVLSSIC